LNADCEFQDTNIPLAILLREELLISVGCKQLEIVFCGNINPKNDLKILFEHTGNFGNIYEKPF
jgi:hypothetical protein